MCGNPTNDREYYEQVLLPIAREELGKNPRLFLRDGGLRFRINQKSFVEWLKQIGLPAGEAKGSAAIPDFIASSKGLLARCIRGIYNTDGCVYFDRRLTYLRPYPRTELQMTNKPLLEQLDEVLSQMGINHSLVRRRASLSLETAGLEPLGRFLQRIGFSNPYHIRRIGSVYPEMVGLNRD